MTHKIIKGLNMLKNILGSSVQSAVVLTLANVLTREATQAIEKIKKAYKERKEEKDSLVIPEED